MKSLLTILIAGAVLLLSTIACEQASPKTAKVELRNSQGEKVGSATLTEATEGVKIALQVSNLPPGTHGFHIQVETEFRGTDRLD